MVMVFGVQIPSRGDRIQLRGGGEFRGVVVPGGDNPKQVMVQTEGGSKPIPVDKSRIVSITKEPSALDDYFVRRDHVEQKAETQFEFGQWCEQNKLSGLAGVHYRRAVELDNSYAPAHKKLGHVLHNDAWITYDELREAQGMVKHKGKWISRQEQERISTKAAESAEKMSWVRRIQIIRHNMTSANSGDRAKAEQQLEEIRDPAAIPGLVKVLGNDTDAMRVRLARILGAISGAEAQSALIQLVRVRPS
jgi:hypothetical protein